MNYLRLVGIAVLFVFVGLGTVGGCGSSGGGGADSGCCVHDDLIGVPALCFESTEAGCDAFGASIFHEGVMCENITACGLPTAPILLTPINDEIIQQNNPNIGCPFDPTFGFGWSIFFDWTDSESSNGISGYQLFVIGPNATIPLIDSFVNESEFTFTSCNAFIIDSNLMGWQWNVQAIGNDVQLINARIISDISETQTFQFEQCRLEDGTACNAQPPSGPPPPEGTIIVPNSLVITEGSSGNSIPLSCLASSTMRYQQVYLASEFGSNSCNINEIRFRTDASESAGPNMRTQNDVAIQFSTTSVSPMTLSTTYANNIGSDVTNVFSGNLAFDISPPCGLPGPCPFDTIINLQTPFLYNPSMGNLLLDISLANCTGDFNNQNFWDATGGAITVMNRLFNFDVNAPTGNIDGGRGLVTQFVCE